jgi:hypothetical protein
MDPIPFLRPIEVHAQLISSSAITLLFPILLIPLNAGSYANEKKDNFLLYVRPRTMLSNYVVAKGLVNAIVTFTVAFLMIFIPFCIHSIYRSSFKYHPSIQLTFISCLQLGTFGFLAEKSNLLYGIGYSLWVAINGALYTTIAYLLSICFKNKFVALSIPFLWWVIMNFVTAVLGIEMFSPVYTVFPFTITAQPIWTVFIPIYKFHILQSSEIASSRLLKNRFTP